MRNIIPQLIVPSEEKYFLAQRVDNNVLPYLLQEPQSPFLSFSKYTSSLDLVQNTHDKTISVLSQCSWLEGYTPLIPLFNRLMDLAFSETVNSSSSHFSLDLFQLTFWHAVPLEFYPDYGLEMGARLRRYTMRDRWM